MTFLHVCAQRNSAALGPRDRSMDIGWVLSDLWGSRLQSLGNLIPTADASRPWRLILIIVDLYDILKGSKITRSGAAHILQPPIARNRIKHPYTRDFTDIKHGVLSLKFPKLLCGWSLRFALPKVLNLRWQRFWWSKPSAKKMQIEGSIRNAEKSRQEVNPKHPQS